jgi:hypothetical protein
MTSVSVSRVQVELLDGEEQDEVGEAVAMLPVTVSGWRCL